MNFLSPLFNEQTFDANGNPLNGGKIYTYAAGTSTPLQTYTTQNGVVQQSNPIILNSRGEPTNPIWLIGSGQEYKFVLRDANDNLIRTVDDIAGINDQSSLGQEWIVSGLTPTYISGTSFSFSGDQTLIFTVGRRLQTTNTSGLVYSRITSSTFSAGFTTIVVVNDSTTLDSGLSVVAYGILSPVNISIPTSTAVTQAVVTDGCITPAKMVNAGAEYASYNRVTNGDFSIKQRSSASASDDTYCFDRWYLLIQSGSLDAISITTDAEAGQPTSANFSYSVPGVGPSKRFGAAQIVESINIRDLRSKAAILSARISITEAIGVRYAILEWTGTADSVTSDVVNNWASTNYTPGNFFIAGVNVIATGSITPSVGTWTDISCSGTFGSSTNNAIVFIWMDSAFTVGGDFRIGLVQLEQGSTKTPFKRVSYQAQLSDCRRFYTTIGSGIGGSTNTTTAADMRGQFGVSMRIAPTLIALNSSPGLAVGGAASASIAGTWSSTRTTINGFEVAFVRTSGTWTSNVDIAISSSSDVIAYSADL